jgi:UDP-N-acetyl-D-mannosaminuronic acid dehydrogenase
MSFNTISVVGLGYIGLPTAAMFASRKIKVIGVDVNQHAVDTINRGEIHIVEPDLDMIVHAAVTEGYLKATIVPEPADAFLIAVPTPFKNNDSEIPEPDLSYIKKASEAIAPVLKKGDLVILESTSPVGATEQMAVWLAAARPDLTFPGPESSYTDTNIDVNIAHCPERVLPGHVVRELVENDRVIGGITAKCSARSVELYKTFVQGECVITNARTAEMAKLTEIHSGTVIGVEPNIKELPASITSFKLSSIEKAEQSADVHLLLVDHKEFKNHAIKSEYLIDTKGVWK